MYSTKLLNKNVVEGNKYITIGDPYKDPLANTFRQDKKGDASKSFICKVFFVYWDDLPLYYIYRWNL